MKIFGICVSVNYSDFLVWSLPAAKNVFDRTLVITSKDDDATKRVCEYNHVEFIETDIMYANGAKFNKGMAINLGLDYLDFPEFGAHFDSDIVMPPRTREILMSRNYNKDCIYSCDRMMVSNWKNWINFYTDPKSLYSIGQVKPNFDVGYRLIHDGYQCLGYFQMFHKDSKYLKRPIYPNDCESASQSDLMVSNLYPPENRVLIPELFVYHLDSDENALGLNWNGRKSNKFGPNV